MVYGTSLQRLKGYTPRLCQPSVVSAYGIVYLTSALRSSCPPDEAVCVQYLIRIIGRVPPVSRRGIRNIRSLDYAVLRAHLTYPLRQSWPSRHRGNHSGPFPRSIDVCTHESPGFVR